MSSFADDFKQVWHKPNNSVARIIIVNVAVFLFVNIIRVVSPSVSNVVVDYLAIPSDLVELVLKPWTIITSFFLHESFGHIFWNMLIFYWFGSIFIEFLGARKLTALYILGGLAGGLSFVLFGNLIPEVGGQALGASASVTAIIVGAATLMPNYRMHLFLIGPVKLKYIAAVEVILFVFGLRGWNAGGEIAHLGGALMGFVFIKQLRAGNDWSLPILSVLDWLTDLVKPKPKMKVSYRNTERPFKNPNHTNKADQEVVDRILDKIHESGYDSLTKEEKQILFKASKND